MYELEISNENVERTLIDDVLKRNECIYNFLQLIYTQDSQVTISIDGEWGAGKTFFVKQLEYVINKLNVQENENKQSEITKIINNLKNRLSESNINTYGNTRAIYYNACEYDYFEEPILTIIADIIKNNPNIDILNPHIKESIGNKIDKFLSSFKVSSSFQLNNGSTIGIEFQKEKNEGEKSIIEKIILDKELEKNFKLLLEDLLVESSNKLIIFIDELDRCNPKFAVKLLEKIKYFFNDDRFIFVFSTNLNQLQYTIENYYGTNFDGIYYLQKFFDYQLELSNIKVEDYVRLSIKLIDIYSRDYFDSAVMDGVKNMQFQLRDCNKYFELLKLKYSDLKKISSGYSIILFVHVFFPLLLAIKIKDFNMYRKIKSGNGKDEFCKFILKSESVKDILISSLGNDANVNLSKYANEIYQFMYNDIDEQSIIIGGKLHLHRNNVNRLENLLSYLGGNDIL